MKSKEKHTQIFGGGPKFYSGIHKNIPDNWVLILIFLLFFIIINLKVKQFITLLLTTTQNQKAPWKLQWTFFPFFYCYNTSTKIPSFSSTLILSQRNCSRLAAPTTPTFYKVGTVQRKLQDLLPFSLAPFLLLHHKLSQMPRRQQRQKGQHVLANVGRRESRTARPRSHACARSVVSNSPHPQGL